MSRIRHIALLAKDPVGVAKFYAATFGLAEVERRGDEVVYLSDGHVNLAIIAARDRPEGIFHFGFQVDDTDSTAETAFAHGAPHELHELHEMNVGFVEHYIHDPAGTRVDIFGGRLEADALGGLHAPVNRA